MKKILSFLITTKIGRSFSSTSIYALTTGSNQRCGVAIVRLSGPATINILSSLTKREKNLNQPEPRKLYLNSLWHPLTGQKIDRGMTVLFKAPHSFTGEDVCEFHVHGGSAVIASLFSALASFPNVCHAQPGEFSKRFVFRFKNLNLNNFFFINYKKKQSFSERTHGSGRSGGHG
jgi:tRNA U34 5-carboxymethylaminomethyl modifying GTPase MnmE/TrmE